MWRARLALVLAVLAPMTLILLPVQLVAMRAGHPLRRRLPHVWQKAAARMLGMRVRVVGRPVPRNQAGTLVVSNHVSWLDIVVLGSVVPVSFVAKDDVAGWPGVGVLAKLQESVFIDRTQPRHAAQQVAAIRDRLVKGDRIVLFPEGTTSDGNFLLPFKSALFAAAGVSAGRTDLPFMVQPVAIAYTGLRGVPMGRYDRPLAAWPGDVELVPHLRGVLGKSGIDVTIVLGTPFPAADASSRKALAQTCQEAISDMLSAALRGRTPTSHERRKTLNSAQ